MAKYEIMVLADTKFTKEDAEKFFANVFPKDKVEITQIERSELAYPINNSAKANWFLTIFLTDPGNIDEFRRRARLDERIWRTLEVNLDNERGLNRTTKDRPEFGRFRQGGGDFRRPRPSGEGWGQRGPREFKPRTDRDGARPFRPAGEGNDRPPRQFSSDGARPFSRDGARPFSRDGARPFSRDGARPFSRDGARPFSRDGAKPFSSDGARPFSRDGAKPFSSDGARPPVQKESPTSETVKPDKKDE